MLRRTTLFFMLGTEHCSWWLWQIGEDPRLRGARKSHFGEGEFPG